MTNMDIYDVNQFYKEAFKRIGLVWETGDYVDDGYSFEERE